MGVKVNRANRLKLIIGMRFHFGTSNFRNKKSPEFVEFPGLTVGAPEMIRTSDSRFRKPELYPLSYGGAVYSPAMRA